MTKLPERVDDIRKEYFAGTLTYIEAVRKLVSIGIAQSNAYVIVNNWTHPSC